MRDCTMRVLGLLTMPTVQQQAGRDCDCAGHPERGVSRGNELGATQADYCIDRYSGTDREYNGHVQPVGQEANALCVDQQNEEGGDRAGVDGSSDGHHDSCER